MIKLLELFKTPAMWLYALVVDQTRIELSGQYSNMLHDINSLPVSGSHMKDGGLQFAISTRSQCPIEIIKVAVDYSAPLQLLDPMKMGFFQTEMSNNEDLPFRIFCKGNFRLHSKLRHYFALTVQFPPGVRELPVCISVHARTFSSSVGGFESYGRTHITKNYYRIVLTEHPLLGLVVPPKHSITSPQPFLIQSALYASGEADLSSILIHEQMADGTVSSKLVEVSNGVVGTKKEEAD